MAPIEQILVAVDFSDAAAAAAQLALDIARPRDAEVTLFHVDQLPAIAERVAKRVPAYEWEAYLEDRDDAVRRLIDELVRDLGGTDRTRAAFARDEPVRAVVSYASSYGADLIATGTHGPDPLGRFVLGSVAAGVAANADRPVLVTRRGHAERYPRSGVFARPVVAVDTCREPLLAAAAAAALSESGTIVDLVTAWPTMAELGPRVPAVVESGMLLAEAERRTQLNRLAEAPSGIATRAVVRRGGPAHAILEYARDLHSDLIAVGRGAGRLDALADRILSCSPVPVLVVPSA